MSTTTATEIAAQLTPERVSRVRAAIEDCNRYIAREDGRDADLRPAEIQKRLEWYKEHRAKLLAALEGEARP